MWQEIEVVGLPTRSALDHEMVTGACTPLELPGDVLPPHSFESGPGMWFLSVQLTDFKESSELPAGGPDVPMGAVVYTGTIEGTQVPVRLAMIGEVLDHCWVDVK